MNHLQTLATAALGVEPDGLVQFTHCALAPPCEHDPAYVVMPDRALRQPLRRFTEMGAALDYAATLERLSESA